VLVAENDDRRHTDPETRGKEHAVAQSDEHLRRQQYQSGKHREGARGRKSLPARQEQLGTDRDREDRDGEPPELSGKR